MAKAGKRSNVDADLDLKKTNKSKSSRTSQQAAQIDDVLDSEEDAGHSMSVQFLAVAKETTKRSNTAVANFTEAMEQQKQTLYRLFDQNASEITTRDTRLQGSLITLLTESQRQHIDKTTMGAKETTRTKLAAHSIFYNAKSGIAHSRQLLEHYDRMCQRVASTHGSLRTESNWEAGRQTVHRVVNKQAEKTKLEVHHLLHNSSKSSSDIAAGVILPEEDDDLWKPFAVVPSKQEVGKVGEDEFDGWGVAAKRVGRSVHHMVKHIPEKSEW